MNYYDVFLYKYKPEFFKDLDLKDIEDLRLTEDQFKDADRKKYEEEFDKIFPKTQSLAGLDTLREALKENYVVQKLQAKYYNDHWLHLHESNYWEKYREKIQKNKKILKNKLAELIKHPETFIAGPIQLTSPSDEFNCVISISDFKVSLNALDNGLTLILDAKKLENMTIKGIEPKIVENDVIEVVAHYQDKSVPIFYGFVVNVTTTEKYGEIIEYIITCAGLSKFLQLSRVIQDPALVSQFEQGAEIERIEITPFEHYFSAKNVVELFDYIMTRVYGLESEYKQYSTAVGTHYTIYAEQKLLRGFIAQLKKFSEGIISDLKHFRLKNIKDEYIKEAQIEQLFQLAKTIESEYKKASDVNAYISSLESILKEKQKKIEEINEIRRKLLEQKNPKETEVPVPYQLNYTFSPGSKFEDITSFQFSITLLLLIYFARKLSKYSSNIKTEHYEGDLTNVFAIFSAADENQYKVYNVMVRDAWRKFYSQLVTPMHLLDEIRINTFYEVFEERPNIIKCRPPRYNIWQGDIINPDEIIERDKMRNDAQLVSWVGYKFMFPYFGTFDFLGGRWIDSNTLIKYGLRAESPKTNPNVTSPTLGDFWSAMDLIRSNISTRIMHIVVPANKDYHLGCLYFIPDKENPNKGIVGYINSISTNINYGSVNTHTLELIYIREAQKVIIDGKEYLNFYRIPDLETFMQFAEYLKKMGQKDLSRGTAVDSERILAEERAPYKDWAEQEAISFGGYYYAVDYPFYPKLRKALEQKSINDINEYIDKHSLYNYVIQTGFRVEDFASKSRPNIRPLISQELINRLWLMDVYLRNIYKGKNERGREVILIDAKEKTFKKERLKKEKTKEIITGIVKNVPGVTYLTVLEGMWTHSAEYKEFLDLKNTQIEKLLDLIFEKIVYFEVKHSNNIPKKVKIGKRIEPPYNFSHASLYYEAYTDIPGILEIGVQSIPVEKRLTIENLAYNGGLIGYKLEDEIIEDKIANAHRYGLEVDLMPNILEYWSLEELERVLQGKIYSTTGETSIYTLGSIFKDLPSDEKNTFIKTNIVDISDILQPIADKLHLTLYKGAEGEKSKVKASFENLLSSENYEYKIDDFIDTYHLQVNHEFNEKEVKPELSEVVRFKINFKGPNGMLEPIEMLKAKYTDWIRLMLTNVLVSEAVGTGVGAALISAVGLAAAPLTPIIITVGAIIGGSMIAAGIMFNKLNKLPEEYLLDLPYKNVEFWFNSPKGISE